METTPCLRCIPGDIWDTAPNNCYGETDKNDSVNAGTGGFDFESPEQHVYDPSLSKALVEFLVAEKARDVIDIGCGNCAYVGALREAGIDAHGIDANVNTVAVTKGLGRVGDVTTVLPCERVYDWVLCLEVGEHVPKEHECTLIQNLHNLNSEGIILSWAVLGQPGNGHVNCRTNEYMKNIMSCLGYTNDLEVELRLRNSVSGVAHWFRNTLMVFRASPSHRKGKNRESNGSLFLLVILLLVALLALGFQCRFVGSESSA